MKRKKQNVILIVDNKKDDVDCLIDVLELDGFQVKYFEGIPKDKFIPTMKEIKPDLVVLDVAWDFPVFGFSEKETYRLGFIYAEMLEKENIPYIVYSCLNFASFTIQAESGRFNMTDLNNRFFSKFDYLPSEIIENIKEIINKQKQGRNNV